MYKLRHIFHEHWAALLLGLVVSVMIAFPQVYFRWEHRDDGIYQGIELLPDSPWSPRVREVQDGYVNFGSIYWKEGKDLPYLFQPLGSIVWGYTGKALGLDINNTLLGSRIIFGFLTVLAGYWFVFAFTKDKLVSLSSVAVILLADSLLSGGGISRVLGGVSPENFLSIGKPVNNTMIYIPFFLFLATFWKFYREQKIVYGILSAVILGLNFYNYFYTWTYLYAFGGLLGLTLLVRRKWSDALRVLGVYSGALLVAAPYLINLHQSTLHPLYADVSARLGIVETHGLLPVGGVVIGAILTYVLFFPRGDRERYWFGLALVLAPIVTLNQQVLTGKIMQAGHYHWYFHKPVAVIVIFAVLFSLVGRMGFPSYRRLLALSAVTVAVAVGAFVQIDSYFHAPVDGGAVAIERQKYGPVMQWLSEHANKDDVVLANDEVSHLVVIYTPLNVFLHRASSATSLAASDERLLESIFTFYRLRGVGEGEVSDVFSREREFIVTHVYHLYYREQTGSEHAIPNAELERLIARYKDTLQVPAEEWLRSVWEKYQVEYFVWDMKSDPDWALDEVSFLEEAVTFGDIRVYRFPGADRDN